MLTNLNELVRIRHLELILAQNKNCIYACHFLSNLHQYLEICEILSRAQIFLELYYMLGFLPKLKAISMNKTKNCLEFSLIPEFTITVSIKCQPMGKSTC